MTAITAELPGVLAAARPVGALGYVIELGGIAKLALTPDELGPLLGMTGKNVRRMLIHSGLLRTRNLHPGSPNGRYLVPVQAVAEWLDGSDDPVPSAL